MISMIKNWLGISLFSGLFCVWVGHTITEEYYRGKMAENNLKIERIASEAKQRVIEAQTAQNRITQEVSKSYESNKARIVSKYSRPVGLLNTSASGGTVSTISNSSGILDGTAYCHGFPERLRQSAELQTLQLIQLQKWVEKQRSIF